MTLRDVLNTLKRGLIGIMLVTLAFGGATAWYTTARMPDTYSATTTLYILISQEERISSYNSTSLSANMGVSQQIANDISQLIMSERASLLVNEYLDSDSIPPYSVSSYTAEDSRIMSITVTGYDRESVADVANAYAMVAAELAQNIMNVESINVIDVATTPRGASGPNRKLYIAAAAAAGAFGSAVLILVSAWIDTKVRNIRDAERASGFPSVGKVPMLKMATGKVGGERRAADLNAKTVSDARDAVMTAVTNLLFLDADKQARVLVVSSPGDEEGRSTLACLAAQTLAASGNTVLLMEGDLNNRSLADMLDIHPEFGLNAVLTERATLLDAVRRTKQSNLFFLDIEPDAPNATGLFSSKGFKTVLKSLRRTYDYVIIDTPPATSFVYASVLASYADATMVIVREGVTRRGELRDGSKQLRRAGVVTAGVVLNCASVSRAERRAERRREKKRRAKEGKATLANVALRQDVVEVGSQVIPVAPTPPSAAAPIPVPTPAEPDAPKDAAAAPDEPSGDGK